ncbi:MAG: DoxX family protein [Armatimonadota bacterium]|nr:DoxX family protein [Armatimonadota bacterium]MDR7402152.1 DoxX family protein [Armatimonadota bacterium]MDR7436909.1 DoxX family protein [Armatimonadota bacterium]MDR7472317.1 DoxX family protein [Armatimonadota bacterium]MDR7506380.1 DoxX family protein [Armatimonadota bacterium]
MAEVRTEVLDHYQDPPFARALFASTRYAWLWALIRVWLGWQWIDAARHKIGVEAWTGTGAALKAFWERAIQVPPPPARPPVAFPWYRAFLQWLLDIQAYTWFAKLVAYGELLVGVALVLGAFVGIAAFFAGFMNWNFMMAGTASTNPLLFTAAILLILAWKVAGYYGLDRWLLPLLGTPWRPGKVFRTRQQPQAA